jgi:hypothetical protein
LILTIKFSNFEKLTSQFRILFAWLTFWVADPSLKETCACCCFQTFKELAYPYYPRKNNIGKLLPDDKKSNLIRPYRLTCFLPFRRTFQPCFFRLGVQMYTLFSPCQIYFPFYFILTIISSSDWDIIRYLIYFHNLRFLFNVRVSMTFIKTERSISKLPVLITPPALLNCKKTC